MRILHCMKKKAKGHLRKKKKKLACLEPKPLQMKTNDVVGRLAIVKSSIVLLGEFKEFELRSFNVTANLFVTLDYLLLIY